MESLKKIIDVAKGDEVAGPVTCGGEALGSKCRDQKEVNYEGI